MPVIDAPDARDWLFAQDAEHYPYTKGLEEAKNDPWIIFHTSGTTGKS
jgi:acyl-coenzyme A synthetase/AMP-(fatty) acid ligase